MDRQVLLDHLQKTRFAAGDRAAAQADARKIAGYLRDRYGARVFGIGSAFSPSHRFLSDSDIDLVVQGLPPERYFEATARAAELTLFSLDVIPLETASESIRTRIAEEGVEL